MVRRALVVSIAIVAVRPAAADDAARADDRVRALGTSGRYAHGGGLDGGALELWWREPVAGGLWAEGAAGVLIGTLHGRTTATLSNPVIAIGARRSRRATVRLALTLPGASRRGDAGALASALAADHPIDPSRFAPDATTVAGGLALTRRGGRGYLRAELAAAWTFRPEAASLPLLHVDLSGAVTLARGLALTAGFRSTAYILTSAGGEEFVHVLALGACLDAGAISASAALEAPIDGAARDAGLLMATATFALRR